MNGNVYITHTSHKKSIQSGIMHKKAQLQIWSDGTHYLSCGCNANNNKCSEDNKGGWPLNVVFHIEAAPDFREPGKTEVLFLGDHIQFKNVRCWHSDYSWGEIDHSKDIVEIQFQFWPKGSKPTSGYSMDDYIETLQEIDSAHY